MNLLTKKRLLWIAYAVVFLLLILAFKNDWFSQVFNRKPSSLTVGSLKITDLVYQDSDGDTIPDWEERLWGTDPNNKDTNGTGIGDAKEIEMLRSSNEASKDPAYLAEGQLTNTDKFAMELFSTVSALSQSGEIDQTTLDKLSVSLAGQMYSSNQKRIYTEGELNIDSDESLKAVKAYNDAMGVIYKNYNVNQKIIDILEDSIVGDSIDTVALMQLEPIIKQTDTVINGMLKIKVPNIFKYEHLEVINGLEKVSENLKDILLVEKDIIVSLSAISQYGENGGALEVSTYRLKSSIWTELNK